MDIFEYKNRRYRVISYGASGDCLFQCLASVTAADSSKTRQQVVDFIYTNWSKFAWKVINMVETQDPATYNLVMGAAGTYGSFAEVEAAAELYKLNITAVIAQEKSQYELTFHNASRVQTLMLLFTGNVRTGDGDGHFRVLEGILPNVNHTDPSVLSPSNLNTNVNAHAN